jgi:hypothetical protein
MKNFLKDSNFNKLAMLSTISLSTLLMILSGTASFVSNTYYAVYAAAQNVTKTTSSSLTGGSAGGSNGGGGSQQASTAHCDRPGFPSCASLGSQAGKSAPGTPTINNNNPGVSSQQEASHCDQPGYPSCYDVGNHDGYNNAVNEHHQFNNSCPLGHSKTFCNGYVTGYNLGVSYNLGYSRGVNNSNHDWESSNHDIHAFNYDCPSTPSKDFCNGYIDGYGDGVHDILG